MMEPKFGIFLLAMSMAVVLSACGDGSQAPAGNAWSSSESDDVHSHVCGLLTREQVDTVVPGNDGGQDRDTSEATLLKDVGMEHCSYLHVEGTDMQFLDLIVYKASSDKGFEQIDIADRAQRGSVRKLEIGDIGFLDDTGGEGIEATASKGRTVFELKLVSNDAKAKSEQLIELARIVAGKL